MEWVDISRIIDKEYKLSKDEKELKKEMEKIPNFDHDYSIKFEKLKGVKECR
ncbi:hypothetical protein [Clostridioides difficile]|uniref:hypothetical protein n=1 Tax=Clostridioides difficile TaxID=1496 RepID=UPI00097FE948|nr:hypothetical protein [Clostridioides difficile]SJO78107.1 Uncharacterised protein [Clostridioides difficile]